MKCSFKKKDGVILETIETEGDVISDACNSIMSNKPASTLQLRPFLKIKIKKMESEVDKPN